MSQPLLSIGMIVKNEERCLEKCLKALEPLRQAIPCELVIADTGSTDKTKEIAAKYADVLFDFKWVNDFSKARNAVMDRCSGKWYLTVDADEYLVPEINELVSFLLSPTATKKQQATVVLRNHFSTDMNGTYSDFNAQRMCRMNTNTRYTNTIHEYFYAPDITFDDIHILNNTIFDHDGYAYISPEHRIQKEARNLELLEENLKQDPNNLRLILQCLESSTFNSKKRLYFTDYAIKKLKSASPDDYYWDSVAANLAMQIAVFLNYDKSPLQDEWFKWAFKIFNDSKHITIDTKYIYTKYLLETNCYKECIKAGKEYLSNLSKQKDTSNVATSEKLYVTLQNANDIHRDEIKIIIAFAMIKENRKDEALKLLSEIDLLKQNNDNIKNWFKTIGDLNKSDKSSVVISKVISDFLKNANESNHKSYSLVISEINKIFSDTQQKDTYKLLYETPDAIGISAKLCDVKSKEETEKLLNNIDCWEHFMPSALKRSILLKVDFPSEFYLLPSKQLDSLISKIHFNTQELKESVLEYYCNEDFLKTFPRISFVYKLLSSLIFNGSDSEMKLLNKFAAVSEYFLNTCYNFELLQNEDMVQYIPEQHLFSWYFVKATKEKEINPLEYLKTLKVAVNKVPKSKAIVEFLIEKFKNEEEKKKQNQIKNASPELVALAEQLKTMLSAFPENSPELIAIKQSPMYKQVAFLIEN